MARREVAKTLTFVIGSRMSHDPDYREAFDRVVRTAPLILREAALQQEARIAVLRRDYAAGRKLYSVLAGQTLSEAEARGVIDRERARLAQEFWAERRKQNGDGCRN
jgi:hypothetical protein